MIQGLFFLPDRPGGSLAMPNFPSKKIALYLAGLCLLLVAFSLLNFMLFLFRPADETAPDQVVVVEDGISLRGLATELERHELVTSRRLFILWARAKGYSRKIKAGEYTMSARMTPAEILEKLTRGLIMTHAVTIPEGFTKAQIADLLEQRGFVAKEKFLSLTVDPTIAQKYDLPRQDLEGYLYPDTYHFARDISTETIIEVMVKRFAEMVEPLHEKMDETGLELQEVITLASIVEKETGRAEERPLIASVFLKRLARGMRLESDPTVIYGLSGFNGNLTRKDLRRPSPYNTYLVRGLPPGPIANPGIAAIKAILSPAKTKYLYFVSKNDRSHHFSRTLTEHNRAVNFYQKKKGRKPPENN